MSNNERVYVKWNDDEVKMMLQLFADEKIVEKMDSKSIRHTSLYRIIQNKLLERGINRTEQQIRTKYKNLRTRYFEVKEINNTSGAAPSEFIFFEYMDCILATRPKSIASKYGVDTSTMNVNRPPDIDEEYDDTEVINNNDSGDKEDSDDNNDDNRSIHEEKDDKPQTPKKKKLGKFGFKLCFD